VAFYPLSPGVCLRIGPDMISPEDVPAALPACLTPGQAEGVNLLIASRARRSVIAATADPEAVWRERLRGVLASATPHHVRQYRAWGRPHNGVSSNRLNPRGDVARGDVLGGSVERLRRIVSER
jgi:hypothetical protein